ncbi:MAG: hypothetical protein JJ863_25090 [Deltaproteobacteria bacterium]|nr:hypothetical protein [Deltaproteobacteria bacterium]
MEELFDEWMERLPEGKDEALVARVAEAFGRDPSPRLVRLLARIEKGAEDGEGPLHLAPPSLWALDAPNLFEAALGHPLRVIAGLTGSLPIGSDIGGRDHFVRVDPDRDEVALYDPAIGELERVADSLASFAGLLRFQRLWAALEEAGTVDTEDAIDGEVDLASPELAEVRALLETLDGHLHLPDPDDTDITTDDAELLLGLLGEPREAPCALADDFRPMEPLLVLLTRGGYAPAPEPSGDPSLARLVSAYFHLDDAAFEAERVKHADHPARVVRDAATFLGELVAGNRPAYSELPIYRSWVKSGGSPKGSSKAPKELLELVPEDRRPAQLTNPDAWDQVTYKFYSEKDFERMLTCAEISTALRPGHYYGWMQKGIALQSFERYEEALDAYHQALCHPGHTNVLANIAITWVDLDQPDTVRAVLDRLPPAARDDYTSTIDELKPFAR